jgi:hypothetical protein
VERSGTVLVALVDVVLLLFDKDSQQIDISSPGGSPDVCRDAVKKEIERKKRNGCYEF